MSISLQAALREMLHDWQSDFSSDWRAVIDGVELAFDDMDAALEIHPWEPIFPSRRGFVLPGEPEGAHTFRAFDELSPTAVRCLVIGQDPYPNIAFSTGRAFESGEHRHWRELGNMRSPSMRCLVQSLHAFRSGGACSAQDTNGWSETLAAIDAPDSQFPPPMELAQSWVEQGVLLLNSSLTLSRFETCGDPHQIKGHLPLWRPLMTRILRHFCSRESARPVVCLLFGAAAQDTAFASGITDADTIHDHPAIVTSPHPADGNGFLKQSNPFVRCNEKLAAMGAPSIHW
ncbi:MAG: uracil-DNA glycosylase [Gammaproteobacteria bacterium]|nr:uracil-DNA glycosylase [Gammaproteobacteria bacterium]